MVSDNVYRLFRELNFLRRDRILKMYNEQLFGTPPSIDKSGKLSGGAPPDMERLTRLFLRADK